MSSSAPSLPPASQFWGLCRKFLWQRAFFVAVASYMLFSVMLLAATDIDICIPCLWRTIFGVRCPGCGLTHAAMSLLRYDPVGAWEANPLVFVVAPAGLAMIYLDIRGFLKKERTNN